MKRLSEDEVVAVLDGRRALGREHDILEVKNAQHAYDMLGELGSLFLDDLLHVHGAMMEGPADNAALVPVFQWLQRPSPH